MECAAWTYELAPTGAASAGLEDYEIRAADGEHLGIGLGARSSRCRTRSDVRT
jgi:hypothetical protein